MTPEIIEACHQLRTGDLVMVHIRHDEKSALFYCTLRARQRVIADIGSIPNETDLALSSTNETGAK